jgi:predicted  nucleic acid-binding Zn-ribbon protein
MIPEFLFIAAALVVGLAAFAVLRQDKAAFASNLKSRIAALQVHVKQREAVLEGTGKIQSRYLFLKQSCQELTQKENRLKEDIALLEPRAGDAETKLASLAEEKSKLEAHLQTLEQDKRLWEDRIKELDRMDELVGESFKKQKELELQITETEEKIAQFAEKLKEAEAAESKLVELKEELTKAEEAKTNFEKEMEALRKEKTDVEASVEESKKELEDLENRKKIFESMQLAVEAIGGGGEHSSQKVLTEATFSALFEPEFKSTPHPHSESPDDWLKGFTEELKNNGYDFPERLIHAFHTSLKVQDVSCLTVMAGISGTGKSALPRLYADYMGLHFLLVPVEPRWDSPQDLFGFLNYMENRYEATPLGRALNQFNLRDEAKNEPMQNEVLLVLLDEMNLARVEYYFSEFLSRLETRRDVDWQNDDEAYQKVSMEIFAGEESGDQTRSNPVRLFAGTNILFVGTMNEDESTQSLTDKVIDRSNAIHFGRPKSLRARPTGAIIAQEQKISFAAWKDSIQPGLQPSSNAAKIVDAYLTRLNESFDRIGRPFGHRAFAATCAYIANHPKGLSDELVEMTALSDQIAMRFLPKLRGLDINENEREINSIRLQLAELEDEAVMRAFDTAADRDKGYFQWRGIDWDA